MSDPLTQPYSFGLPTGRILDVDSGGYPEGAVGNICALPRAIPQRVEMMRKRLPNGTAAQGGCSTPRSQAGAARSRTGVRGWRASVRHSP